VSNKHTQVTSYYAYLLMHKKSFNLGANAIYGRIVRLTSEEVVLQLNKKQVYTDIIARSRTFGPIYY